MEGYTIILYKTVLSKQKIQKNEREVHLVIWKVFLVIIYSL